MPNRAPVVLQDASDANHTFNPAGLTDTGTDLFLSSTGTPIADKRLTVSIKDTAKRKSAQVKLTLPVVQTETVNGISSPVVVRSAYVTLDVSFDRRSTDAERADAVAFISSATLDTQTLLQSVLVDLERLF